MTKGRGRGAESTVPGNHNCSCEIFKIDDQDRAAGPLIKGLPQLFSLSLLADLTDKDKLLAEMKKHWLAQNFAAFKKIAPGIKQFFNLMSVQKGIVLVDNRIAVPAELREAVLTHLHLDHPGQVAMIDAASYLWWPKMHRQIIEKAEKCDACIHTGKNLKSLQPYKEWQPLPELSSPNEEIQIDFAGPLYPDQKTNTYILVAIDRYSKFPTAMITKTTSTNKIVKFVSEFIATFGTPKLIRVDQFPSFKSKELENYCTGQGIDLEYCPIDDHRANGQVERCIQTIKRRLATCQVSDKSDIQAALTKILHKLRITKCRSINMSPFEKQFGRKPNTVFTNTLAKLGISDISLARSLLKHDDRDSDAYSKDRLKVVRRGEHSPDILPLHPRSVPTDVHIHAEEALRKLQKDAETWKELTKDMSDMERTLFARDTLPNPDDRQIIKEVDGALGLNLYLESAPSKLKRKWRGSDNAPSDSDLPDESSGEEGNGSETVPLASVSKALNKAMAKKGMTLLEFVPKPNIYENNNECEFDLVSPDSVEEDKHLIKYISAS